jgi:hypothetical protein
MFKIKGFNEPGSQIDALVEIWWNISTSDPTFFLKTIILLSFKKWNKMNVANYLSHKHAMFKYFAFWATQK